MMVSQDQDADNELLEARQQGFYEIGYVATVSGVRAKMIRHYETTGLLPPARRTRANYRIYDQQDIQRLRLIKRARLLGFPREQIEALLKLWHDPQRASLDVKQLVLAQIDKLDSTILSLQEMRTTLMQLAQECHGDQQPECAILHELSQIE
ncbi:MAG: Cu(I)-responsive transcriptional regulator [Enterobacteriaceae bacterium]